jgi:hypothetical protein
VTVTGLGAVAARDNRGAAFSACSGAGSKPCLGLILLAATQPAERIRARELF